MTRYKATWCVREDLQRIDLAYDKAFAAVVKINSWRLILVFVAVKDWECLQARTRNYALSYIANLKGLGKEKLQRRQC